jgi:hypothetical protein
MANGTQEPLMMSVSLSRKDAREFLRRLAEDDAYRRRLQNSPQKALAEANIVVPKSSLPERVTLPTKQEIRSHLLQGEEAISRPRGFPYGGCFVWGLAYLAASRIK